ncbi:TetR/AcrR family transcriptional regulator [Parendozoicomonas haliclonae]|uniref:Fatty acid metabolism regulator protein n=1 Tax=Parendozoicomonas haliclonae TaxID=1960125 RepID=A0A1X7APB5_9GAMM|nr:TetR/AcrR family transcriptional regulator [Parendozoicomonas haliclonae]SMA49948.1 Fatty acid metabolism regulator protein [Parendozoicomonas haliclonae]
MSGVDIQQLLNIRMEKGEGNQVVAWSDVSAQLPASGSELPRWLLTAVADACAQNGASRACDTGMQADLEDSSRRFFTTGEGHRLLAVSEPIYARPDLAAWQTRLYRLKEQERHSPESLIADFSHSYRLVPVSKAVTVKTEQPVKDEAPSVESGSFMSSQPETIADKRRQQIFKGACEVFSKKGFGSATIREIAKAAEITIPTMYKYIRTKEDILFMITQVCMEEIFAYFKEALKRKEAADQKMKSAIRAYVHYVSKNRRHINLVYRETRALNAENRNRIFNIERDFMALWEKIIADGIEEKVFRPTDTFLAANMIYFFCNVWALRHWSLEGYSEQEIYDKLVEFIMPGLQQG